MSGSNSHTSLRQHSMLNAFPPQPCASTTQTTRLAAGASWFNAEPSTASVSFSRSVFMSTAPWPRPRRPDHARALNDRPLAPLVQRPTEVLELPGGLRIHVAIVTHHDARNASHDSAPSRLPFSSMPSAQERTYFRSSLSASRAVVLCAERLTRLQHRRLHKLRRSPTSTSLPCNEVGSAHHPHATLDDVRTPLLWKGAAHATHSQCPRNK